MGDQQVGPGLYVKLGLDVSGMTGGIGGVALALNQSLELLSKFEMAAQKFFNLAIEAGQFGKAIKDNARDLGLSTDQFQQWTHAAIAAGSSAEEITASIRMMSVRMKDARDPTSEMGKTLTALGVSVLDSSGKMRSMNDVLLDIFPALNALPEGFDRNQASMALFGKGFSNIADLASLSRAELLKLLEVPPAFNTEKITRLDEFNTEMSLLNVELKNMNVEFGMKLVPVIKDSFIPALESAKPVIYDLIALMDGLSEVIDRTATGYAMIRDPGNWEKIAMGFNARQAARQRSRNEQEVAEWSAIHSKYDPFGMSKNPLFAKKSNGFDLSPSATTPGAAAPTTPADRVTYNSTFAGSLQSGGIGPDWGGYSALAEMTTDELQGIAAGGLGKSKGMAEKAQQYLSMMGSATGTKSGGKAAGPGTPEQTKSVQTEYDKQITTVTDYFTKVEALYTTKYPVLDALEKVHWTAIAEMSRIAYQSVLDNAATAINFAGSHPVIQKIVMLSASGYDIDPSALPTVTTPSLKAADFSGVVLSGSTPTQKTGGNTVNITVNQTNNGVKTDAQGMNKALGGIAALGGALP